MNSPSIGRRLLPASAAFAMAFVGVLALAPRGNDDGRDLVPVIMATRSLSDGTSADVVRDAVEVRMVPASVRAEGAITSPDSLPEGVLAYDLVSGQQVLATAFAASRVRSLGDGYVAVSAKLDPQRWVGALLEAGRIVDVYDTSETGPRRVAARAVILQSPDTADLEPSQDTLVSLGVPEASLADVLLAIANNRVWLVGR
ncbi:MAG: pilus assembly protein [Actinomycetota bacterium]|jgi:hypothetical protein